MKPTLTPEAAAKILAAAPQAQENPLAQAMKKEPNPEIGADADGVGANPAQAMVNSMQATVARTFGPDVKGGIQ